MLHVALLLVVAGCDRDPLPVSSEQLCEELAAASDCGSEQCVDVLCTGGVVGDGDLSIINDQCPTGERTTRASRAAIETVEAWCWEERRLSFDTDTCLLGEDRVTWATCVEWQGD
jgi:hypothetical protein